jgi:hypothetical protein
MAASAGMRLLGGWCVCSCRLSVTSQAAMRRICLETHSPVKWCRRSTLKIATAVASKAGGLALTRSITGVNLQDILRGRC